MNDEGPSCPVIYFQRERPPPPSSSPFSVAHIWATPSGIKKEVWRRRESAMGWGRRGVRRKKKNSKTFSSGCNLSLSWLQHSRVILQCRPGRDAQWQLCAAASHPSETSALNRLPQSMPPPLRCWDSCCYLGYIHIYIYFYMCVYMYMRCVYIYIKTVYIFLNTSRNYSGFHPVRIFVWYNIRANLAIIGGAVDKCIFFSCSEREHNRLKCGVYLVERSVSDIRAKSQTSGCSLFNSAGRGLLKMLLTLSKSRSRFIRRVTRLPLLQSKGLKRLQSPLQRSLPTVICVIPTLKAKQTTKKREKTSKILRWSNCKSHEESKFRQINGAFKNAKKSLFY